MTSKKRSERIQCVEKAYPSNTWEFLREATEKFVEHRWDIISMGKLQERKARSTLRKLVEIEHFLLTHNATGCEVNASNR